MNESKGKLDANLAMQYIADHYDTYLQKENNPCSRTVCSHYELDARKYMSDPSRPKPFAPRGAVDGIVADSEMVKNMSFMARWGVVLVERLLLWKNLSRKIVFGKNKNHTYTIDQVNLGLYLRFAKNRVKIKNGRNFGKKYRTRGRKGKVGKKTRKTIGGIVEETTSTNSSVVEDKPAEVVEEVVNRDELIDNVAKE